MVILSIINFGGVYYLYYVDDSIDVNEIYQVCYCIYEVGGDFEFENFVFYVNDQW